jgi:acyl-coenzyme A synthetase/AMP-(fatty) acid ligase
MSPDDVTLSVPKLFFGYATGINLLFPFSVGATAALFPERCTAETLFEKIRTFRPTILANVPTMVNQLLAHPGAADQDLSSLRLATSAGEALPVELHRRWNETFGVPLLDGLGTAEMWHIFISNRPDDVRPGTLGRAVPGFDVKACDDEGVEVAAGEAGHLWVRGGSMALGYWQQSEKTRAQFRGDWYVSGDMISVDAEGYVTYHGRADDMLKVSGKWLSPTQLEDCLLAHPAVAEVAVVGVPDGEGLVKPHAFVRVTEGHAGDDGLATALQAWAKERLEPFKYPRRVVFLDDFPRTHLGKVDRGALARH